MSICVAMVNAHKVEQGPMGVSSVNNCFNPIQAGLFWNHIGWGAHCAPLCFSSICCPITTKLGMLVLWYKISQKQ